MAGRNLFAEQGAPMGRNLFASVQQPAGGQVGITRGVNDIAVSGIPEVAPVVDLQQSAPLPETTPSGLAGAVTRGAGPIAAGAAGGALLGAPFVGVGAIPGAVAGASAAALTEFVGDPIVDTINNLFGTTYTLPTDAIQAFLTKIGVPEADTEAERIVQSAAQGAAGAGGAIALGKQLAGAAAPVVSGVGKALAAQPVAQLAGGGVAAGTAQIAAEADLSPSAQIAAGLSGALIGSKIGVPKSALKTKLAAQIKAGGTDKTLAKYMINGMGKLETDKVAKETIKQGFDQGVVAAIKGASKLDRTKMSKMVEVMEKGKANRLFGQKNRPSDIAGDSLLNRVRFIKKTNREAGAKIDIAANSLKGKNVDFQQPVDNFMQSLDDMGIKIGENLKPDFRGSDIEGLAGPVSAINKITKRLSSGKPGVAPDAFQLHRTKRFIDEIVTYGKSGEGLKGKTERILKSLRRDLDDTLDSNFPKYNEANTIYADTVGALDALQDVAGKKMDLFGPNADKATGTLLRRMLSNAQSRVNLVDAVDDLDVISKKYGSNFGDDIATQMLFVDELDSVFGPVARTSLAGETAKGVKAVAGQRTVAGAAVEAVAAGAEKLRGINEANAFKSMKDLLKRQ